MNINKFTQKSMEAVQNCEKLAYEYGNQQIEQEHLFYSLLTLDDSLILKLLTKMGISKELITNEAQQKLAGLPKVSGSSQVYISNDLNKVLINAEDESKAMGDEYVYHEGAVPPVWHYPGHLSAGPVYRARQPESCQ